MGETKYKKLYKVYLAEDASKVIAEGITINEVAELLGISLSCAKGKVTYQQACKGYIIEWSNPEEQAPVEDNGVKSLYASSGWDKCMYEYRIKHGLDLSHWNEFYAKQEVK